MLLDKERTDKLEEQEHVQATWVGVKQKRSRAGKPWSAEEDADLFRCLVRGFLAAVRSGFLLSSLNLSIGWV